MSGLPANFPTATKDQLVSAACELKRRLASDLDDLAKIEERLIGLGAGKYFGLLEGEIATVVAASIGKDKVALAPEDEEKARTLAGDSFSELFERHVSFAPCEAFTVVAPKLLTPAKAKKLVALCSTPTKGKRAHVRYA